jgi:hypothetical protein
MHLQTDVFAPTEGATDTTQREAHALKRQTKTSSNLFLIFV